MSTPLEDYAIGDCETAALLALTNAGYFEACAWRHWLLRAAAGGRCKSCTAKPAAQRAT